MIVNSSIRQIQETTLDDADAGEGLAIFFSQEGGATVRWRLTVYADIDEGVYEMGEIYVSPPNSASPQKLSRMIGAAVCPGATGWRVGVYAMPVDGQDPNPDETANIILASSKCCTAPVGVSRVSERYNYSALTGNLDFTVRAGMTVTGIAAIGLTGGGSVQIAGGASITIPDGVSVNLSPEAPIAPESVINFTNVDWVIEYLESA